MSQGFRVVCSGIYYYSLYLEFPFKHTESSLFSGFQFEPEHANCLDTVLHNTSLLIRSKNKPHSKFKKSFACFVNPERYQVANHLPTSSSLGNALQLGGKVHVKDILKQPFRVSEGWPPVQEPVMVSATSNTVKNVIKSRLDHHRQSHRVA